MSVNPVKFSDRPEWFSLWSQGKESMLATMVRNLHADLDAGYNPVGSSITSQISEIALFRSMTLAEYNMLGAMPVEQRNRWCFDDLKRRGVIE